MAITLNASNYTTLLINVLFMRLAVAKFDLVPRGLSQYRIGTVHGESEEGSFCPCIIRSIVHARHCTHFPKFGNCACPVRSVDSTIV